MTSDGKMQLAAIALVFLVLGVVIGARPVAAHVPGAVPGLPDGLAAVMIKPFVEQLERLATLPENWDGYGAPPISEKALLTARQLIATAIVAPMSHGGVLVEMCGDAVSIEIDENGEIVWVDADR